MGILRAEQLTKTYSKRTVVKEVSLSTVSYTHLTLPTILRV